METFRMNWKVFLWGKLQLCEARPGLSGALFLFCQKKKKAGTEDG